MTDKRVDLWLDPACPWAWLTSRWLLEVEQVRPIQLSWQVMSLALLHAAEDLPPEWEEFNRQSMRPLRLLVAAVEQAGASAFEPLYTSIGRRIHIDKRDLSDDLLREAVAEAGLGDDLMVAADDVAWDSEIGSAHRRAVAICGDDVGTPIIAVDGRGIFGPVLSPVPRGTDAAAVWDAVDCLTSNPGFYELKRTRSAAPDLS